MSAEMTVGDVSTPTQQSALAACVARGRGGVALLRRRAWLAFGVGLTLALAAVPAAAQPADTDGDGLFDEDEVAIGTDPNLYDTDGDGFSNGGPSRDRPAGGPARHRGVPGGEVPQRECAAVRGGLRR